MPFRATLEPGWSCARNNGSLGRSPCTETAGLCPDLKL